MHQSCLTLCDSIDGSPPGSPVPGIIQARTLEWVAISFSNASTQGQSRVEEEGGRQHFLKCQPRVLGLRGLASGVNIQLRGSRLRMSPTAHPGVLQGPGEGSVSGETPKKHHVSDWHTLTWPLSYPLSIPKALHLAVPTPAGTV